MRHCSFIGLIMQLLLLPLAEIHRWGTTKIKPKSHLSRGKYKEVNPPLWWSNSDAQSKEFVIMSLRFCTKIITLIVLHFCGIKLFTPCYYSHCQLAVA